MNCFDMKKNYPTLKEVFMREEEDSSQNSRFVSSMRKQFGRPQDKEGLDYVARIYDHILQLVQGPEGEAQEVLKSVDGFFKFHYRIAYQEYKNGSLDPTAVPSGEEIMEAELEKRHTAQASAQSAAASRPTPSPADRQAAHIRSVYGGDPNKNPGGLGT